MVAMHKWERLRRELCRTLVAFAFTVLIASAMAWLQLMNDNASVQASIVAQPSLLDASRHLHSLKWVRPWMADVTLYVMVGGSICGLLIYNVVIRGRIFGALQIARRFFWLMGLGYSLRGLTLFGTILPPSNPSCRYMQRSAWEAARAVPQLLSGSIHTCSDKIFSGHTLVATLLAAFWFQMAPVMAILPRLYAAANWTLMVVCSLGGRHHYTVDIVVGAIVAALLFHLYHLLIRMVVYEDALSSSTTLKDNPLYMNRIVRSILVFMDGMDIRDAAVASATAPPAYLPLYSNCSKNDIKIVFS